MKAKIFILCLLFIVSFIVAKASPFVTRWDLSIAGSGATQLSFGVGTSGTASYTWETIPAGQTGSGTFTGTTLTITGLPIGAMIRLSIDSANFNRIHISFASDRKRILDVEQWGNINWVSMEDAFSGCENLNISSNDIPDLSNVNNMTQMFSDCISLNGPLNIGLWNTSNVIYMNLMFANDSSFNQYIGTWDVSNVTRMDLMFHGATNFNQPVGTWNTSNVTLMECMFCGATNFNQPVGTWNTSNVHYMYAMFYGASSFNQSLSSWNLKNVDSISFMFDYSGMDCANYSNTLIAWNANPNTPNNLNLGAATMQYDANAQTSRSHLITTKGWTINGDTLSSSSCGILYNYTFLSQTICEGDTFLNQTNSGVFVDTLLSIGGNDTIRTLNLTVLPMSVNLNQTICQGNSYLGYSSTGVYVDTLVNSIGCDSIRTLTLNVNPPLSSSISQTICQGQSYGGHSTSGLYIDTLVNILGCDSIRTLTLTVNPIPNPIILQNGPTLSASNVQSVIKYSWYKNGFLIGGNYDTVTITQNGVYVLAVKDSNNCIGYDTLQVISLDVSNIASSKRAIQVYPNPSSGVFSIDIPEDHAQAFSIHITDLVGAIVYKEELKSIQQGIYHHKIDFSSLGLNEGMYMLSVTSDQGKYMPVKLVYRKE